MTSTNPDAIRSPLSFAGSGDSLTKLKKLQDEYAILLGTERIFVRNQGIEHFVTSSSIDTLYFPSQGTNSGKPRYDWMNRGDGVLYGFVITEA